MTDLSSGYHRLMVVTCLPSIVYQTRTHHWKRDRIISSVNSRVKKVSHKYGVKIPKSAAEALRFDEQNNDTCWLDAIDKEMGNLKVAFDILEGDKSPPPGYTKASGHIIFHVRMTMERKARQ